MAKNMYARGKIYKIVSEKTDSIYVGSTCQPLGVRMCGHRSDYKASKSGTVTKNRAVFKLLEHDDAKIVLLEQFPCKTKEELLAREQYWIDFHKTSVNFCNACPDVAETIRDQDVNVLLLIWLVEYVKSVEELEACITTTILYEKFTTWCKDNEIENVISKLSFCKQVNTLERTQVTRISGKSTRGIITTKKDLLNKISDYVCVPADKL